MTSAQAKERIQEHLLQLGYREKRGRRYLYLIHPDGKARYKLTTRTITGQAWVEGVGWVTRRYARSLIQIAQRLAAGGRPDPAGEQRHE